MSNNHETNTPVSLRGLSADDPHLQPAARKPARVEKVISISFVFAIIFGVLFIAEFVQNWQPYILGGSLAGSLLLLGIGLVAWGKYLMPRGPFVEDRHEFRSSDEDRAAFAAAIIQRGGGVVKRRKVITGLFAGGMGVFSLGALFPLLRSLGPLPKGTLFHTDWRKDAYAVDITGRRVLVSDLAIGSIITVYPEGKQDSENGQAVDQTVLIRITHLGCPVGLYEQQMQLLVCPCHQSMFNVNNGAVPQFGPAPRPLPQLPIYIDADGYIRAQSDYHEPVGPGFWERS